MSLKDYISEIYLASQSPARLNKLRQESLTVHACPQYCDEHTDETEPGKVVESLSMQKLEAFLKSADFRENRTALACDTMLYFEDEMIGKAHNPDEAFRQISSLSGKVHYVYSGFCLYYKGKIYHGFDCAEVKFSNISNEKIEEYIASNEWKGAAGSYHIFGEAVDFIEKVEGDINTVIGLPLKVIEKLLDELENKV